MINGRRVKFLPNQSLQRKQTIAPLGLALGGIEIDKKRVAQEVSYGSPDFHKDGRDFFSWHAV
jgi:hypothetical protein